MRNSRNNAVRRHALPPRAAQTGLSLVELIVAMVIGLTVVGAALAMYVSSGFSSRGNSALSQMTEDANIALSLLRSQVAMAGYGRVTGVNPDGTVVKEYTGAAIFGCTGGPGDTYGSRPYTSMVCEDDSSKPDSIVTMYQADGNNTVSKAATPDVPTDCLGNDLAASGGFYVAENRYFIQGGILRCLGNGTGASAQPLVENIADMKVLYGVAGLDGTGLSTKRAEKYMTAQQVTTKAAWNLVTSVRICVLVRSEQAVLDAPAPHSDCSGGPPVTPVGDKRLYRAFTTTVVLQNRI